MNTNKKFIGIILFSITAILYSSYLALNQNMEYTDYGLRYINTKGLISSNPNEAIKNLNYLQVKDPENYIFYLDKARAYLNLDDIDNAIKECDNALKQRPVLNEDNIFLSVYGQILYLDDKVEEAKKTLEKLEQIGIPEGYEEEIKRISKEINKE